MPWELKGVVEQRLEFVQRALDGDGSISSLCREYGISRVSGHKWIKRYREAGTIAALKDQSRRPLRSPNRTVEALEIKVVELYQKYGWGPKKIHKLLLNDGTELPLITVRRIYRRYGLSQDSEINPAAFQRFERTEPNELVQMDYKGQFKTDEQVYCYPLSLLDDHSRFCLGLHALEDQTGKSAQACLVKTFEEYGVPEGMLMDHGTPWWNSSNGWGLTQFSVQLIKQGIKLSFSRVRHPQTQGKVERFHRTLKQELSRQKGKLSSIKKCAELFDSFRYTYNTIRPHEALDLNPPITRYRPSKKQYSETPLPWAYPEGCNTMKVDHLGRISFQDRRFFICEALPNEYVRVVPLEMSALVIFRDMVIREIDLDTGASVPTVFHVSKNFSPLG